MDSETLYRAVSLKNQIDRTDKQLAALAAFEQGDCALAQGDQVIPIGAGALKAVISAIRSDLETTLRDLAEELEEL